MGGKVFKTKDEFNPAQRIPTSIIKEISEAVVKEFSCFFKRLESLISPDIYYKKDHGDVDVLGVPFSDTGEKLQKYCEEKRYLYKKNGPMRHILYPFGEKLHQVDFIFSGEDSFEIQKQFYKYPVVMNCILGHVARSLYYKFSSKGLYLLITDKKGQRHLFPLTKDITKIFDLLMLDKKSDYELFQSSTTFANWIMSSPRFDNKAFKVSENTRSHRDARSDPFCTEVYSILENSDQKATIPGERINFSNPEFNISKVLDMESDLFGDDLRQRISDFCTEKEKKAEKVINGRVILEMGYPQGPIIGEIIKAIKSKFSFGTPVKEMKEYVKETFPK